MFERILNMPLCNHDNTSQKIKFSIKDFFSNRDQIPQFPADLVTCSDLLKKSLMENFIFCTV